ncbi:MAG: S-layer homology domain-containing protein [Chloroflexota bacterium]|nr:S-layer homology domain-containing protein [Chloroflexota bacterium]
MPSPLPSMTPTPAPTLTRVPETNYVDQALANEHAALLAQIEALPTPGTDSDGALVSGHKGGRIKSRDAGLTIGILPETVATTATLHVQVTPRQFGKNDPKGKRNGQPLAFAYELHARNGNAQGQAVARFNRDVSLIWNIDHAALQAEGITGWPLHVYTYDEERDAWTEVPSWFNHDTGQLVARTPHFSEYAVGGGFDKVNNYLPAVNNFEVDIQSGTASTSYPINLPPGPGGFGPNVSLSYSSGAVDRVDQGQQGSSSVGWGWTLSTSYIAASQHEYVSEDGRSAYYPWTASIVSQGANGDLIKGTDGVWHTASESFAKIVYNNQTDSWEAWDKSGTHYVFDLRAKTWDDKHSVLVTNRWMLNRATDVHGNTITYKYWFEEKGILASDPVQIAGPLYQEPITDAGKRTRAVYPRQITYGATREPGVPNTDAFVDKIKVDFNLSHRAQGTLHDVGTNDRLSEIFQGYKIDRIDVSRMQSLNNYALLRSYVLTQDYSTVLGVPYTDRNGNYVNPNYLHLTLTKITIRGNDTATQLPSTTFTYYPKPACGCPDWYGVEDWGHLYQAANGYGGSVWFYYDAAGADVSSYYRRVRNKRVRDGLQPLAPAGSSNEHDALYTYQYAGATTNSVALSDESAVNDGSTIPKPLHQPYTEFRGFGWVRVTDPSGQATDHYFSQDDKFKATEWRTSTGRESTHYSTMNSAPGTTGDWYTAGRVDHLTDFPAGTGNAVWKVWANASVSRTGGINDGSYSCSRFQIVGAGDKFGLEGKWILRNAADSGDYWGLKIARNPTSWPKQYQAWLIWSIDGVPGSRYLSAVDNAAPVRPYRPGPIELREWYNVCLHSSPDGRFAMELARDNRDYIQVKSTDPSTTGGALVPLMPTGQTWKAEHLTSLVDTTESPGYQLLLDEHQEVRTVYTQSDTSYADLAPVAAAPWSTADWRVGPNNTDGMRIHLPLVTESSRTTFGHACCELGRYFRTRTTLEYTNDGYRNLYSTKEHGDVATSGDERTTYHGYHNINNTPTRYLPGLQVWTHVYKGISGDTLDANWMLDGTTVYEGSDRWDYVAPNTTGKPVRTERWNRRDGAQIPNTPSVARQRTRYDIYGNSDQMIDGRGNIISNEYDPYYRAFPLKVTYPNGRSETTAWDFTKDTPTWTIDVNNVKTEMATDVFGRPLKTWISNDGLGQALGSVTTPNEMYTFPDLGSVSIAPPFAIKYTVRLSTVAGPNEHTWQARWFDGRGRTIQDVSRKGSSATIRVDTGYNLNGQVEKSTLPFEVTTVAQDAYRTPTWNQAITPYVIKYYDGLGRSSWVENPDGTSVMYQYSWLNRVDVWDEMRHGKFTYTDAYGRLSYAVEYDSAADSDYLPQGAPHHIATQYIYDVLDNLTEIRRNAWVQSSAGSPVVSTIKYDGLGHKREMNDPDMGKWEYEYDEAGNLKTQRDALFLSDPVKYADHQLFIEYDEMNRPIAKYYGRAHWDARPGMADVRYWYDDERPGGPNANDANAKRSWGRLHKAEVTGVDGRGALANSHTYSYNARGQLLQETINSPLARNNGNYTVGYEYDVAGRFTALTYPDPELEHERVSMLYNEQAFGLPNHLDSNKDNGVYPVFSAGYNVRGQLTELKQGSAGSTVGDLLTTSYTYDDVDDGNQNTAAKRGWLNRTVVTAGGATTLLDLRMTYSNNGNVTSVSQTAGGGSTNPTFNNTFTYDQKERLRSASSTPTNGSPLLWSSESYTFDDIHRMRTRTIGGTSHTYTYPAGQGTGSHLDAPTAYRGATYQYDANGNQIMRTQNGLTEIRTFDPEGRIVRVATANTVSEYIYDANGQRLIKTVSSDPCPAQPVTWQNPVGVTVSGNTISRNGGSGWAVGASSSQAIASGDGYMEFIARNDQMGIMAGLGNGDTNATYGDIEYALHLQSGTNNVIVFEAGQYRGTFGTYSVGDRFRVAVEGGVVRYYRLPSGSLDWVLLYTSGTAPTYPLRADASLNEANGAGTAAEVFSASIRGCSLTSVPPYTPTPRPTSTTGTCKDCIPPPCCCCVDISVAAPEGTPAGEGTDASTGHSGQSKGTQPTGTAQVRNFTDVPRGSPFYEYVSGAAARGIVGGYADGTFRPDALATRGQFVKMVMLAFNIPVAPNAGPTTQHFSDVPASHPFYAYIEAAYARGLIGGYADGTFKAEAPVTRGQGAKIVVLAAGLADGPKGVGLENPAKPAFSDVGPASTFYRYIEAARSNGLLGGYADGTFRPNAHATRGQVVKITYLASKALADNNQGRGTGNGDDANSGTGTGNGAGADKSTVTATAWATPLPGGSAVSQSNRPGGGKESASGGPNMSSVAPTGAAMTTVSNPGGTLNTTTRTIFIKGLYEEELTGAANPPYTAYYTLSGKLVGMRRANQGSANGQYRIVGDHLGSTSLIVSATNTPSVVQRTYNKPYGEVAWSWSSSGGGPTSLTSIGYTGQRLEAESGLMYYGARFYDPALAYFVSADTIAPGKGDSKTRNRYSYVLNNPLRYADPTGHRAQDPKSFQATVDEVVAQVGNTWEKCQAGNDAACRSDAAALGLKLEGDWKPYQLQWLLEAIHDLMRAAGWNYDAFKSAIGGGMTVVREKGDPSEELVGRYDGKLHVYDYAFDNDVEFKKGFAKRWLVHEVAHRIDHASWNGKYDAKSAGLCAGTGWFSCGMAGYIGGKYSPKPCGQYTCHSYDGGVPAGSPSRWARDNNDNPDSPAEDFAETVAAMVYANDPAVLKSGPGVPLSAPSENRQRYVRMIFDFFR